MSALTHWLSELSGPVVYVVVAALVFAEDAFFFGFVLPGETAVIVGGVLARQGVVDPVWLSVAVVLAAIAGDGVGYEIGRRLEPRLIGDRRRAHRVEKARDLVRRRGPAAVFVGRFIAFLRSFVPAMAGASEMPYRRFLLYNALGGLLWGVGNVVLGYAAGAAYERAESLVGRTLALVAALLVIVALVVWRIRRHRERNS
ncbi:DedA family protein [Streptomyces cylindrosporus]|uniref:DedA family protein n=1 Tax=Streptomyces cylindrosporus TaxID=2927583 RepID=A0ABS9YLI6_9ACTN|nr:DedA family protein [Streptomyces cylindrosporus]MCI3278049.1 DedA family protein [Streptomyces cylindrosporus]